MQKTVMDLHPGEEAIVTAIEGTNRSKMMDMGITVGTVLRVRSIAPFGDPREIVVQGYSLLIRNSDAAKISVAPILEVEESQ